MKINKLAIAIAIAVVGFGALLQETTKSVAPAENDEPILPDWAQIANWPNTASEAVEVQPDPNRLITAIVLDDSSSMGADIIAAKAAIVGALDAMADSDRVAVIALNAGTVLSFSSVQEARLELVQSLRSIKSNGTTPLTRSVERASEMLEAEAAVMRGFGAYRLIVTTDGKADDPTLLKRRIEELAAFTPIQLTTIGIDVGARHVLKRGDLGSFVDVGNVGDLESALQAAVAENPTFAAITEF